MRKLDEVLAALVRVRGRTVQEVTRKLSHGPFYFTGRYHTDRVRLALNALVSMGKASVEIRSGVPGRRGRLPNLYRRVR